MSKPKSHFSNQLILGVVVVVVGFTIEKLRDELTGKSFYFTVALVSLAILVTAIIGRVQVQSLTEGITSTISDEIKETVDKSLNQHMKRVQELDEQVSRAALHLRISNPASDLRKFLLTAEEICEIEKQTRKGGEIYVVTRDLDFDEQIESTVASNLNRDIRYFYFYPEDAISDSDIRTYKSHSVSPRIFDEQVEFVSIPKLEFSFLTDFVIYDPHKSIRTGYGRLPTDELPGGVRALLLINPDSLKDISESLSALLKRREGTDISRKNRSPEKNPSDMRDGR